MHSLARSTLADPQTPRAAQDLVARKVPGYIALNAHGDLPGPTASQAGSLARPKQHTFTPHAHVGFFSRYDDRKAYVPPDDGFQLRLPFALKVEVRAERPIMFPVRRH